MSACLWACPSCLKTRPPDLEPQVLTLNLQQQQGGRDTDCDDLSHPETLDERYLTTRGAKSGRRIDGSESKDIQHFTGSIAPDATLKNASLAKPLIRGAPRSSMSHSAKAADQMNPKAQGSQSDEAKGPRQPIGSSRSPKAANRIKQEAGFPSCFPDETLILAVFNCAL
ncbi:hypothetical protein EYF80_036156 [Liparis tanakae]|uniref:Uncharacterized protein n=1 Tax=Liparis tanakae TaxID=230148 RepID=A0A4Z2GJB4_9TELE|nr:hypothetical protein EYF80_036156 [Liparis tanakae]